MEEEYSTRIFGTETGGERSFSVSYLAEFNHYTQRFFLSSIQIEVPHGHPRNPLTEEQQKILDSHVVITDGKENYDYLVRDSLNVNMFDFGVFIIRPKQILHLQPTDTITVDVPAKADFFFRINYFIAPL